jgi:hypothetical protein
MEERARRDFTRDPDAASAFLQVGETQLDSSLPPADMAAYASVASTLLCMDETITKQ